MAQTWDIELSQKVADAGARFIKEYIAELREQGKVKGRLCVVIRRGRTRIELDYQE